MSQEQNQPRRVWWRRGRGAKGWRKPDNTVAVTRGTPWGNPFPVTKDRPALMAVTEFSKMVMGDPDYQARCRQQLQGKNLMCFCKPEDPCHADVLLEVANSPAPDLGGSDNLSHCEVVDESNDAECQQVGQEISHDLLLEQGTPGDITAATQQDQGENHLAEGQQDDSTKADESDLLDHGLTLVSHGVPLDPGHYDTDAADLFLEALGFGRQDPVILSAGGKDFWRIPRKPKDGYDWEQVTAQAANGRDWPGFL